MVSRLWTLDIFYYIILTIFVIGITLIAASIVPYMKRSFVKLQNKYDYAVLKSKFNQIPLKKLLKEQQDFKMQIHVDSLDIKLHSEEIHKLNIVYMGQKKYEYDLLLRMFKKGTPELKAEFKQLKLQNNGRLKKINEIKYTIATAKTDLAENTVYRRHLTRYIKEHIEANTIHE